MEIRNDITDYQADLIEKFAASAEGSGQNRVIILSTPMHMGKSHLYYLMKRQYEQVVPQLDLNNVDRWKAQDPQDMLDNVRKLLEGQDVVFIDSLTEIEEHIREEVKGTMIPIMEKFVSDQVNLCLSGTDKPYQAMNDWRNNRNGKKNR